MGWGGGGDIAVDMQTSLCKWVGDEELRKRIYKDLIESLRSLDWDCLDEAMGYDPVFDEAVKELYPEHFYDLPY